MAHALKKKITEPPFGFILVAAIGLCIGIGLCVVAQTFLSGIERLGVLSEFRQGFPTRMHQYNWDFHAGHPWLGLLIGICAGIVLNWSRNSDAADCDREARITVARALGKEAERSPFEWRSYMWIPFFMLFSFVVLTYLLHISSSIFLFGTIASSNFCAYRFRSRVYAKVTDQLANTELEPKAKESVTDWLNQSHRRAIRSACLTAIAIGVIMAATTAYSISLRQYFKTVEATHVSQVAK